MRNKNVKLNLKRLKEETLIDEKIIVSRVVMALNEYLHLV
jgi:hypothetical protein